MTTERDNGGFLIARWEGIGGVPDLEWDVGWVHNVMVPFGHIEAKYLTLHAAMTRYVTEGKTTEILEFHPTGGPGGGYAGQRARQWRQWVKEREANNVR